MSTVRFIADLHFDHPNIAVWRNIPDHDEWLIRQWNSVVKKRDLTWVLGDVSMGRDGIEQVKRLNGVKHLILGNHDTYPLSYYLKVFNKVHGFMKYKGFWLSHAPVEPLSLRGLKNIHGHTHAKIMLDHDHFCVGVEALNGVPVSLDTLNAHNVI